MNPTLGHKIIFSVHRYKEILRIVVVVVGGNIYIYIYIQLLLQKCSHTCTRICHHTIYIIDCIIYKTTNNNVLLVVWNFTKSPNNLCCVAVECYDTSNTTIRKHKYYASYAVCCLMLLSADNWAQPSRTQV